MNKKSSKSLTHHKIRQESQLPKDIQPIFKTLTYKNINFN